ncbi:lactate utilization protein [Acidiphilium sp. AL]|uniref:Lactate utilization protein n=1 Tax=Acidiphilium iwatense TaxID=768198 RepID=A0ABS9DVE4_9PROT|nr:MULTISPECIES: lactate utilization protein [Acidiphilium]MCF3946130.1 lactate utilization protein [Acidiphilium iwatense]MCU4161000.1 lactate utilization protein [Acidiphilium sp. AL]
MSASNRERRDAILATIRCGLKRGALPEDQAMMLRARLAAHPRQAIPARVDLDHDGLIELFVANATREYATIDRIADRSELPEAIASYLRTQNLPMELIIAPDPALQAVDWAGTALLTARFGRAAPADMVSVQEGFAGIAETGTLMLPSGARTPTTLNLLPDTEIVVLDAAQIVGPYEDAFDRLRVAGDMPRNVMLVTGPSRSADIERTLELGAHGPRRLHIVLVGPHGSGLDGAIA